jgi:hypothetical protein
MISYPFIQYHPVAWKLAVIPASGGPAVKIFDLPGGTAKVRWSPAGTALQYLVTQKGATSIWEQPLTGAKPKLLAQFTSHQTFDFKWSANHQRLFLTQGDLVSDVVLLNNIR